MPPKCKCKEYRAIIGRLGTNEVSKLPIVSRNIAKDVKVREGWRIKQAKYRKEKTKQASRKQRASLQNGHKATVKKSYSKTALDFIDKVGNMLPF